MGLSGVSPLSLLLILLIVIALFGTNKLKNIGSDLGAAIKNFRRAMNEEDDKKMSSSELLLILLVAVVVFGPNKLPMLAEHLAKLFRHLNQFKQQAKALWQAQLNEQQLIENTRKAEKVDALYKVDKKTRKMV